MELQNVRNYTLKNPERWEDDRFGPVTVDVPDVRAFVGRVAVAARGGGIVLVRKVYQRIV